MKSTKFKEDSVMSQPSAGQPSFTSGRKNDQIEEMSAGATGSGSIASVASPTGKMQKRAKGSIFSGIVTSEKFPNSKAVKESNDYFKRRKDEEERIAGTKPPAKRTPKQTDYEKKRKEQREVAESQLSEEDIILMPGQGRKLKPGLMSKRHDNEVEMARNDLYQTEKDAKHVCDMLQSVSEMQGLDGWVQAKITKAADYLSSVRKYLEGKTTQGVAADWKSKLAGAAVTAGIDMYAANREKKKAAARENANKQQDAQGVAEGTTDDINKMFGNMYDPIIANLQRVALLAMQGRQQEATSHLSRAIQDASPKAQQKIIDAVNNIKPVVVNGKIADSSTLDKSKQHQNWISDTFIPWIQSVLEKQDVDEDSEKLTPREKFNRGLKRQGFDPDAAASRLEKLIAKQKAEREEFEKAMPDVYGKKEVDEEREGLWANIHAKRERIKHGSGERMRKPGSKGAPTAAALKKSAKE